MRTLTPKEIEIESAYLDWICPFMIQRLEGPGESWKEIEQVGVIRGRTAAYMELNRWKKQFPKEQWRIMEVSSINRYRDGFNHGLEVQVWEEKRKLREKRQQRRSNRPLLALPEHL